MLKNKNFFSIYSKELIKKINNLNLDILEEITYEIFNNIKLKKKNFCLWERWLSSSSQSLYM